MFPNNLGPGSASASVSFSGCSGCFSHDSSKREVSTQIRALRREESRVCPEFQLQTTERATTTEFEVLSGIVGTESRMEFCDLLLI